MSKLSALCNVCQSEIKTKNSRIHERMLALSMDQETRQAIHTDYVNMLRQERVEDEGKRGGGLKMTFF